MDEERTNMRKFRSLIGFPAADRIVSVGDVFREYLPGRGLEEWERRTYFCEATGAVLNKVAVETCSDWFEEIKPKRVLVIEIELTPSDREVDAKSIESLDAEVYIGRLYTKFTNQMTSRIEERES